ncbi:MAG: Tryptophan synthase alpha chain [Myxococcales bacterium]|nr:Tryptophan synthase alpha chain [Myxococcales bacterium]
MFLAYGLVYKLLQNGVPISWVIKPGKRLSTIVTSPNGASEAGTTATITATQPHNLNVGDIVLIAGVGVNGYNGTRTVTSVVSPTKFTMTLPVSGLAVSGGGTVTPSDFTASATDKQGGPTITSYPYRGGPFVIDQPDAAGANPIITAWQTANPVTVVHVATTAFSGYVKRELIAAPSIAMFADGNENIAFNYVNSAKIPDSAGNAWANGGPDVLTPAQVAGTTCPSNNSLDCIGTPHDDGALFDSNHVPRYCQMMSMHWNRGCTTAGCTSTGTNAQSPLGREVVREYRSFLKFPTHLFTECQAANAVENNTNASVTIAATPAGATEVGSTATFKTTTAHSFSVGDAILVTGVASAGTVAIAASPNGATEAGSIATFTTTAAHNLGIGSVVVVSGIGVAGYNGTWIVLSVPTATTFTTMLSAWNSTNPPSPTTGLAASGGGTVAKTYNGNWTVATVPSTTAFTATLTVSGLAASGGGSVNSFNGLFLTTTGYAIDNQPTDVDSYNFDQPFAQMDGAFKTTAGSEPSYTIPVGGGYKAQDVVMLTERGTPVGTSDVWMTGFLDGKCLTTQEFCDPSFAQGKVSFLGGHNYGTTLPISNGGGTSQGTRLFLDALFEAPCATDLGSASLNLFKTAPGSVVSPGSATYTITAFNNGSSVAGNVVITDVLAPGTTFVSASPGSPTCTQAAGTVTCNLGNMNGGQTTVISITVTQTGADAKYTNTSTATYKAGVTTFNATSNTTTTCFYHAGNTAVCGGMGDPNAPKCANGTDDDGDGLIDFPDDPGCDSATDDNEVDTAQNCSVIKGRVLIVQDTSGSMVWNTCGDVYTGGDGSLACPGSDVSCVTCGTSGCGNAIADDSRIGKVKTGITNVVSGFGEVEWGLMRFKQLPVPFSCGTSNVNRNDGGWQGAGGTCGALNQGELLVKFDPENANDLLAWIDGSSNYPGSPPAGKDFELRASGNTPLGGSLATARSYIAATRAADCPQVAACRPYKVILVTDGAETCAGDPVGQANQLYTAGDPDGQVQVYVIGFSTPDATVQSQLNSIAAAGGTVTYVPADNDAQLSAAIEQIVQSTILVELCNNLDDDCDGQIDEDFPDKGAACNNGAKGVCARTGQRVCAVGGHGTQCNAPAVTCTDLGSCTEICNGLDDDCDGSVDEGLTGCTACVPQGEQCNNKDDDCDGVIDEGITKQCGTGACLGTETCVAGAFVGCTAKTPTTETCNGVDDDCDGVADGFTLACSNIITPGGPPTDNPGDASHMPIPENICHPGSKNCPVAPPGTGVFGACSGEVEPCNCTTAACIAACKDRCDGIDQDCDNIIDEDFVPAACSTNCGVGMTVCTNGVISCDAQPATTDNTCDNVDDDCDGQVDEDWTCDASATCTPPGPGVLHPCCACGNGTICNGTNRCINGTVQCTGGQSNPESCNCLDDDCDGSVDEGTTCPGGSTCANCQCAFACSPGEFPCPLGKKCTNAFCVNDPCYGVDCPNVGGNKQSCVDNGNNTSACVDACSISTCPPSQVCIPSTGDCKPNDCTTFGCPPDQNCVVDGSGVGQCLGNPCAGVMCPGAQYCEGGQCYDSCAGVVCPSGQRCTLGTCQTDPCGSCPADQVCNDATGQCGSDRCLLRECPTGQWCNPHDGECEPDPCIGTMCPSMDQVCKGGTCDYPHSHDQTFVTAGGGGCDVTPGRGGGAWIGLLLLLRRRRKRSAEAV